MALIFFLCLGVVSYGVGHETKALYGLMVFCGVVAAGIITDRITYR